MGWVEFCKVGGLFGKFVHGIAGGLRCSCCDCGSLKGLSATATLSAVAGPFQTLKGPEGRLICFNCLGAGGGGGGGHGIEGARKAHSIGTFLALTASVHLTCKACWIEDSWLRGCGICRGSKVSVKCRSTPKPKAAFQASIPDRHPEPERRSRKIGKPHSTP